jgi:hypothetical protein
MGDGRAAAIREARRGRGVGRRVTSVRPWRRERRALVSYCDAALGVEPKISDLEALRRLGAAIGRAACDPREFARRAGAQQEPLDQWNLAMAATFGAPVGSPDWKRCTTAPEVFPGAGWGGRFDRHRARLPDGRLQRHAQHAQRGRVLWPAGAGGWRRPLAAAAQGPDGDRADHGLAARRTSSG